MIRQTGRWVSGVAGLFLALGLWTAGSSGAPADGKEVIEAVKKIAAALEKNEDAEAKKLAEALAKTKDFELDDVMYLFHYRTRPDGKPFRGIGIGPKPGAITPDGIEKKLIDLAKNPPSAKQLADEADALKDAGWASAAIALVALAKGPPMDDAEQKAVAKAKGKEWVAWLGELKKNGEELAAAAKDKKGDALQKLGPKFNQLNAASSCNKCHEVFKKAP